MLGGACCVRGLISSSIAVLSRASWWNTAVHARPFLVAGPRGTREHDRKQPRKPSGVRLVAIFCTSCSLAGGDINVRCCCVVYQFIEIRSTRFCIYFVALKQFCLSNLMQIYVNLKNIVVEISEDMYYAACTVESQPFNRSYSHLTFSIFL